MKFAALALALCGCADAIDPASPPVAPIPVALPVRPAPSPSSVPVARPDASEAPHGHWGGPWWAPVGSPEWYRLLGETPPMDRTNP